LPAIIIIIYTPGSKGFLGLKTKVKNAAGMAIGPGNGCRMSRAKALLLLFFTLGTPFPREPKN